MPGRILVVDDSATILKVVGSILGRAGFTPVTARDGVAGLKLLADGEPFDLILLDFVMPRMNGYQFCRELRKDPGFKQLPIVLMSAKSDRIRDQFVQQTGALDAITKPFDARSLVAAIEGVMAKVKSGRAPIAPEPETMPDEESMADSGDEPRPSVSSRALEGRAAFQLARHAATLAVPAVVALLPEAKGRAEAIEQAILKAIQDAPVEGILAKLREAASSSGREVLSGDLALVPLPEVLQVLQMQKQSGVMRVRNGSREVSVYLREGTVDLARSTGEKGDLKLGRLFVEMGALTRAQVEASAEAATASHRLLGEELVASGKINEEVRQKALGRLSAELVYDVVRWPTGRFSFVREPHPREVELAKLGLGLAGLVLEGFRRVDEWRLMENTIVWDDCVVIDEAALNQVGQSLDRSERLLLAAVDGKRNVGQILDVCELTSFDALKIVYQFLSSRVLRSIPATRSTETGMRAIDDSAPATEGGANPPGD